MKKLLLPEVDPLEVYTACVSGISSAGLAARFTANISQIETYGMQYATRAAASELHIFPAAAWGKEEQLVLGEITKGELTDLYTSQMAKRNRPGRAFYDRLMLLAPLGKCPFCGFGHVSTLDHHLPKALYPIFSVLPANLIPSCTDCNKSKGSDALNGSSRIPHPYFEDSRIETDAWLYALINKTSPATVTFSVATPENWPIGLASRVINYVRDLKLTSRFSIEASSELASLSDYLGQLEVSQQVGSHLEQIGQIERANRKNSWKAALYEALAASTWYRQGGFRRPA